jgi:hypothetical protein
MFMRPVYKADYWRAEELEKEVYNLREQASRVRNPCEAAKLMDIAVTKLNDMVEAYGKAGHGGWEETALYRSTYNMRESKRYWCKERGGR